MRMKCTSGTAVQGFVRWVGIVLALWVEDRWVIISIFWERFWVTFSYFVDFIISLVIFIHKGLCCKFTMLGLIVVRRDFGIGTVSVMGLHVWLSCNC